MEVKQRVPDLENVFMNVGTHFQLSDDVNVQNCVYGAA
jgi:geranylgeranyl pyrophosphate synthase